MKRQKKKIPIKLRTALVAAGYVFGTITAFLVAGTIIGLVLLLLQKLGISLASVMNPVMYVALVSILGYGLTLGLVIWVPQKLLQKITTWEDLGLSRLPTWMDILIGPAAFIPYILLSGVSILVMTKLFPMIDVAQKQELGFSTHIFGANLVVAFILVVVIAPLVEEVLFRGFLYGKLRRSIGISLSTLLVSLSFALLHGQVNVGIDVFALSIVLCLLREYTGSIWAGVLLHMTKNMLAFYLLFVNPSLFSTMGG